jgi:chromosome partitioning protein
LFCATQNLSYLHIGCFALFNVLAKVTFLSILVFIPGVCSPGERKIGGFVKAFENNGIIAKFMSLLASVNASTVSRYINAKNIIPLEGSPKRNCRYGFFEARRLLAELVSKKRPIDNKKKVLSFYNFKGGTGKTSVSYQVATHLALCGYNVLAVDTDGQSHLTVSFGLLDNLNLPTLYDGLVHNMDVEDLIINVESGLDLIPANLSLTKLEVHLKEKTRQENIIKRYLSGVAKRYDFIIFDSNPNITILNRNILSFSNMVNIVSETHPYSVHGMKLVMDDMFEFYALMEEEPPHILIIPNKYEDRSSTSAEAMSILIKNYPEYLIPNFAVRKSEDFPKSAREQLPISFFCKSNSIAFEDIKDLINIIIDASEIKEEKYNRKVL